MSFLPIPPELSQIVTTFVPPKDAIRIKNRKFIAECYSSYYSLQYETIAQQPLDSIFRTALQRIETKHPNWSEEKKAQYCLSSVNIKLDEGRYYLTKAQRGSFGGAHARIQDLTFPQRVKMAEMISEARANALIAFFIRAAPGIPAGEVFQGNLNLNANLAPRENARRIRNWMNINRAELSQGTEFAVIPFRFQNMPSEASIIFPRLPAGTKNHILANISYRSQIEPFRTLLNDHPNERVAPGETALSTLFHTCSRCSNFKFLKELIAHPNFSIFEQTEEGIPNVASWFRSTLLTSVHMGLESLGFLMNLACTSQLDPASLIRLAINGKEKGLEVARKSPILKQLTTDQLATAMTEQFPHLTPRILSSILKFPQAKSLTCKHIKSIFQAGIQYLDRCITSDSIGKIDSIYEDQLDSIKSLLTAFPQAKFTLNEMIIERINDARLCSNEFDVKKFEILQNCLKLDACALEQESKSDSNEHSGLSRPPAALGPRSKN
jgi:hypothetical protein